MIVRARNWIGGGGALRVASVLAVVAVAAAPAAGSPSAAGARVKNCGTVDQKDAQGNPTGGAAAVRANRVSCRTARKVVRYWWHHTSSCGQRCTIHGFHCRIRTAPETTRCVKGRRRILWNAD
jgi:hypothetical protein